MNTQMMGAVQMASAMGMGQVRMQGAQGAQGTGGFMDMLSSLLPQNGDGANATLLQMADAGLVQDEMLMSLLQQDDSLSTQDVLASILQQIQQMLMGTQQTGEDVGQQADMDALMSLIESMQEQLRKLIQEQGEEQAGMYLQQMMQTVLPVIPQSVTATAVQGTQGGVDVQAMLNMVLNSTPQALAQMLTGTPVIKTAQTNTQAQTPETAQSGASTAAQTSDVVSVTNTQAQRGQTDFAMMVRAAKQQMGDTAQPSEKQSTKPQNADIDALQRQVDSGFFMQNTSMTQSTASSQALQQMQAPQAFQIQQGIGEAIANGEDVFSIKLVPEGLGEVTIRLTKTADGMLLDIIAKSADTQKLLVAQSEILQDNLRSMKVQLDTITTERQQDLFSAQQGFGGEHQRQFEQMRGAAYYGDEQLSEGQEEQLETVVMPPTNAQRATSLSDALNTLV